MNKIIDTTDEGVGTMYRPPSSPPALVYAGVPIRDRGEMLSLTDMWKAAGSDDSKRPAEWLRHDATKAFVECVVGSLEVGRTHIQTKRGGRGQGGETLAHWQIALAYAKYLSPEFHMWCNQVVRERMEGHQPIGIPAATLDQIERSFGIIRAVIHKVTEIEKALPGIVQAMVEPMVAARLSESALLLRRGKTAKQIWDRANLPPKIKGSALWFGNRMAEMGCLADGGMRADRGDGSIRLFDPDKAEICLKNGLAEKARCYAAERRGQRKLNLVGGGVS